MMMMMMISDIHYTCSFFFHNYNGIMISPRQSRARLDVTIDIGHCRIGIAIGKAIWQRQ